VRLLTSRLLIRDLTAADLDDVHRILDVELGMDELSRSERGEWLQWTVLDYGQRRRLHQPPYAEYGVEANGTGELIGLVGLVPSMMPFGLLPAYYAEREPEQREPERAHAYNVPEVGLFWAVSPSHQRLGYASEAGAALIGFAFDTLHLRRIVATTEHGNEASIGVMRRLGMRIARNPAPAPFFLNVVGILENPNPPPDWPAHP
jgi:RimJ/RimL family protein N-acetyltransferase